MHTALKTIVKFGCAAAAVVLSTACSPHIPPMSVTDLMEDRVALDGALMKCNRNPAARNDQDCVNARVATERLARQTEPERQAKRAEEFERSREQLRQQQDKAREAEAAKTKVDAYHLPVVPLEPTPSPTAPRAAIVGQTAPEPHSAP
jgi:hypothetical protein